MKCPTMEEVDAATHIQLAEWHRFAQVDYDCSNTELTLQVEALNRNFQRLFKEFGGFTPAISKAIGWDPR